MRRYISAYILDAPYHIDKTYDYYVPEHLEGDIIPGSIISVPFGVSNRRVFALATEFKDECGFSRVKPVLSVSDNRFALSEEMLRLCFFMKEHTLCTIGEAVRCMVPSAVLSKAEQILFCSDTSSSAPMSELEATVRDYVLTHPGVTQKKLSADLGEEADGVVSRLIRKKLLSREYSLKESTNVSYKYYISPAADADELIAAASASPYAKTKLRSQKHRQILSYVAEHGRVEKQRIIDSLDVTSAQIKALIDKGLLREEKEESLRNPYKDIKIDENAKNILSDVQREAFLELSALYHEKGAHAALLYGVTGSGKTRVMKAMIDEVTASGRSVIVLVPEISLTPQTVGLFCSFYGERVAVLHSALSAGEKIDAHKRIREGTVDVVIGTRSAVFAPLSNLGMIIIDEEQEHTYKSDSDPKYHARDIARFRCADTGSLMLLCSATPSVESFYKAKSGAYSLVCLRKRYGNAKLPSVNVCDMRKELKAAHVSPLSRELIRGIDEATRRGEQAIIFLNRRGYNNFVNCRECGEVIECPHCSVSLTAHRNESGDDILRCHYCGYTAPVPRNCPYCNSEKLMRMGVGTQKAAEEISLFVPGARIMRMDADTANTKHAYDKMLDSFRKKEADVLIGTQMVAKGHDFPDVTLVGVLNADASLSMEDYRANERTFSLITQVVGRAGRASKPGVSLIQTFKPESEIIELCCRGDYEEFYSKEIDIRRAYIWPPFCDIVLLTVTADSEPDVMKCAETLSQSFKAHAQKLADIPIVAYGPFEAPLYKLNEKYRMRMVIKTKLNKRTRELFSKLLYEFGRGGVANITLSVDFNPTSV